MTGLSTVAIVTSRLRRLVTRNEGWVVGLRAVIRRIACEGARLTIGQGTAGADFVRRAAIRLGIPFESAPTVDATHEVDDSPPLRDRVLLESVETVYVLTLRNNGNLHRLLRERLQNHRAATILVDLPELQNEQARSELLDLGATVWQPTENLCLPFESQHESSALLPCTPHDTPVNRQVYELAPYPLDGEWDMLTHTTRSWGGPWPDESFESYADCLLESRSDADHSALVALRRIVMQRRLAASGRMIRGGYQVVSFTACPLKELVSLHRYRPHRVRWDFEPYGICIRTDWLKSRGARAVRYGDESFWQSMSEEDRPFFQIDSEATVIDWSVEREWRHPGDLDLTELSPGDALLFVPDFDAAKSVANLSPWPVTLAPSIGEV